MAHHTADLEAFFNEFDTMRNPSTPFSPISVDDNGSNFKEEGSVAIHITISKPKFIIHGSAMKHHQHENWTIRKRNPETKKDMNFSKSEEKFLNSRGFEVKPKRREYAYMERISLVEA